MDDRRSFLIERGERRDSISAVTWDNAVEVTEGKSAS